MSDSKIIHDWVKKAINAEYATRMTMPEEQQDKQGEHFNAEPSIVKRDRGFLSFAKGVSVAKQAMLVNADEDLLRGDVRYSVQNYIEHGGFTQPEQNSYKERYLNLKQAYLDKMRLVHAAVEAETGFYQLSREEYQALREGGMPGPHLPNIYQRILESRPVTELEHTGYDAFMQIVHAVLQEKGLPTELPSEMVKEEPVNQVSSVSKEELTKSAETPSTPAAKDWGMAVIDKTGDVAAVHSKTTVNTYDLDRLGMELKYAQKNNAKDPFIRRALEYYNEMRGIKAPDAGNKDQESGRS